MLQRTKHFTNKIQKLLKCVMPLYGVLMFVQSSAYAQSCMTEQIRSAFVSEISSDLPYNNSSASLTQCDIKIQGTRVIEIFSKIEFNIEQRTCIKVSRWTKCVTPISHSGNLNIWISPQWANQACVLRVSRYHVEGVPDFLVDKVFNQAEVERRLNNNSIVRKLGCG